MANLENVHVFIAILTMIPCYSSQKIVCECADLLGSHSLV